MHLPSDLDEPQVTVKMVTNGVLGEGFDFSVGQATSAEVSKGMPDQEPAEPLAAEFGRDGDVRDMSDARLAVLPGRDVADDSAFVLGDENTSRITGRVVIRDVAPSAISNRGR